MSIEEIEALTAKAKAKAEKAEAYFSQPGYIWTIYLNRNAPYNDRTGHLGQMKGCEAINGAPALLDEYGGPMKAWIFGAESAVDKATTGVQLKYFTPASFMETDDRFPITEADAIVRGEIGSGKLYNTPDGSQVVLRLNEAVPADYIPVGEFIFKAYLGEGYIPDSFREWDPQASNVFRGQAAQSIAAKLKANAEMFSAQQRKGLDYYRKDRQNALAANAVAATAGVDAVTEAAKTATKVKAKAV